MPEEESRIEEVSTEQSPVLPDLGSPIVVGSGIAGVAISLLIGLAVQAHRSGVLKDLIFNRIKKKVKGAADERIGDMSISALDVLMKDAITSYLEGVDITDDSSTDFAVAVDDEPELTRAGRIPLSANYFADKYQQTLERTRDYRPPVFGQDEDDPFSLANLQAKEIAERKSEPVDREQVLKQVAELGNEAALDLALVNYARSLDGWIFYSNSDAAEFATELPEPLNNSQRLGYTFLLQCNTGLKADGDLGSQTRLELTKRNLLASDRTWVAPIEEGGSDSGLTRNDYMRVAESLRIPSYLLRAVTEVESSGGGFTHTGRLKILFEGQWFYYHLRQHGINAAQYARSNPSICYPKWDRSKYIGGDAEHGRLDEAATIHSESAYRSASYGLFQIMGFHYAKLGYPTAESFYQSSCQSERQQLSDAAKLMEANGWAAKLRAGDIAGFCYSYNGEGYKSHNYDGRIIAASAKWKKAWGL